MSLKTFFENLFHRPKLTEAKKVAEESQQELDVKIKETRDAAASMVHRSRDEIRKSRKVILVAEQAIRSMKQVESRH